MSRIPTVVHRVWIQGAESLARARPEAIFYGEEWLRLLPTGWSLRLWDDAGIREAIQRARPGLLKHYDDPEVPWSAKSDIARHAIIWLHGGIYADVSTRPIRDPSYLLQGVDLAFIYRPITTAERQMIGDVNTSWFAAAPRNAAVGRMLKIMDDFVRVQDRPFLQSKAVWVNNATGPGAWWEAVRPDVASDRVRAVPHSVVDPITMSNETVSADTPAAEVRKEYPSAVLIHNGRESWISGIERVGLKALKAAKDNWVPLLISCLCILVIGLAVGFFLTKKMLMYRSCCTKAGGDCAGGSCKIHAPRKKR